MGSWGAPQDCLRGWGSSGSPGFWGAGPASWWSSCLRVLWRTELRFSCPQVCGGLRTCWDPGLEQKERRRVGEGPEVGRASVYSRPWGYGHNFKLEQGDGGGRELGTLLSHK